ncbi:MAG: NUDIX domain-containing protein [Anaerolineales bacterium]
MNADENSRLPVIEYIAAGGVVLVENKVLVLGRPGRQEVRLPKGHVEEGEELREAAMREVGEESGYSNLRIIADLGVQQNEFDYDGKHFIRQEYFFLMALTDAVKTAGEAEFQPKWLRIEDAIEQLSFQVEKEWVRRALLER